jgi:hypothetical protein
MELELSQFQDLALQVILEMQDQLETMALEVMAERQVLQEIQVL